MPPSSLARCFVLRPFSPELQNAWDLAIRPAIEAANLEAWDGQEERLGAGIIHRDISRLVWNSRIIVADLTGRNPNVMYELGLAHAAKKPVILLLEESETPPFDVSHIRYLRYDRFNLRKLRSDLTSRINSTLALSASDQPDLFPELQIVTQDIMSELDYLRTRSVDVAVEVSPACADLFVNDNFVGTGTHTVRINPTNPYNTFSASAVGFLDFHAEVREDALTERCVRITLERVHQRGVDDVARLSTRVSRWLRDRRRAPNNPVLMRAIANYLLLVGEHEEALNEIEELLTVAPLWFMSMNEKGFYYGSRGDADQALPYYEQVALLRPQNFIGHFNLACCHSLLGNLDQALAHLRDIRDNEGATASARETIDSLFNDPDFTNLINSKEHIDEFVGIERALFLDSKKGLQTAHDDEHYTY